MWDVTCVDTLADSNIPWSIQGSEEAEKQAEEIKYFEELDPVIPKVNPGRLQRNLEVISYENNHCWS